MWLKKLIKNVILRRLKLRLGKQALFANIKSCRITKTANIILSSGSSKGDVKIGEHVMLYGTIASASNGKVSLGKYCQLGTRSVIRSVESITVGDFTSISNEVIIQDNNSHPVNPFDRLITRQSKHGSFERAWINSDHKPISIGKNCWIGENSRICKGVTIGAGSVVAANSVVTKSVPENCIVAGNPAKVVKTDIDTTTKRIFLDNDYPQYVHSY